MTVNTDVLQQAFREALQADLATQRSASVVDALPSMTLCDAVSVCTRQMRMHGDYPERVLVAIKSAVCDAAILIGEEQLVEQIVRDAAQACITAYFEPGIERRGIADRPGSPVSVPPDVDTPGAIHRKPGAPNCATTRE